MGAFASEEREFANSATYFAMSAANQYEVARCVVILDFGHDQSTLVKLGRLVQLSSVRAM